jgi:hypothetical protein
MMDVIVVAIVISIAFGILAALVDMFTGGPERRSKKDAD